MASNEELPPADLVETVSVDDSMEDGGPQEDTELPERVQMEKTQDPQGIVHPKGTYFRDGRRKIDFVLAYEHSHKTATPPQTALGVDPSFDPVDCNEEQRRVFFLSQLIKAGLELELHEYHEKDGKRDRKLVFIKLHAPWAVLAREAERLRMKMPLKLTDHIDWPFSNDQMDRFDLPPDPESLFTTCMRSEVVWEVLQMTPNDPYREKRRGIESLLERKIFDSAFPLHDGGTSRQRLHAQWASFRMTCKPQPLNQIRNYFGEKVAFYFAFMDFYTKMLVIPSVFGVAAFLYGLIISWIANQAELEEVCEPDDEPGRYIMCPICQPPACEPYRLAEEGCERAYWQYRLDNISALISASLNLLWCAFFVKFWRRREARLATEWGTHDAQEGVQVVRPGYEKKAKTQKRNPVTDELEPHVSTYQRLIWKVISVLITSAILCAAISCMAVLIETRVTLYGVFKSLGGVFRDRNIDMARWIQHGFMSIMVTLFELGYHRVAEYLTKLECPKTTSGYLSSLLWKVFIFAHLVDFLPIAYAAWVKGRFWSTPKDLNAWTEMCEAGGE